MAEKSQVFEQTYQNYLRQIAGLDFSFLAKNLAAQASGDELIIPFFGQPYRVSSKGIKDPAGRQPYLALSVILCKYLLTCPLVEPLGGNWTSFKDFRDAAPLVQAFDNTVIKPISERFAGRAAALEKAAETIGCYAPGEAYPYDVSVQFDALPKVSGLLLFNDADEEFPAQCSVLFERRVEKYLDMECLAIVGMLLCEYLKAGTDDGNQSSAD